MPIPPPGTVPSAAASKGRHLPVGEVIIPSSTRYPASWSAGNDTPPATAMSDWPLSRLCTARWTATRDEEHPVCTVMLSPRSPNR